MIILIVALFLVSAYAALASFKNRSLKKYYSTEKASGQKYKDMYYLFNDWLTIRLKGESLANWFKKSGYKSVSIYGMGEIGECLWEEMKYSDAGVEVKYGVDKFANQARTELFVYFPDEELPDVDVMIVTPFMYYESIKEAMKGKTKAEIISLEDIIYDVLVESNIR